MPFPPNMDEHVCIRPQKMAVKSQRLRNPFLLTIDNDSLKLDNYKDGLNINVICECSFWLFSFWGVQIKEFHKQLSLNWDQIKNQLLDQFCNFAYFSNDPELYQNENNKIVHHIKAPEHFNQEFFRTTPRDRYPVVVMLVLNDRNIEDEIDPNDIVILVSIIHLKDTLVPIETGIIARYIKRKSGIVLDLQDLYISNDLTNDDSKQMPHCIICLENPISRGLLPCKHTCVCAICLEKINICPLCRTPIVNYIIINQPVATALPQNEYTNQNDNDQNKSSTDNFLNRIQRFFGF